MNGVMTLVDAKNISLRLAEFEGLSEEELATNEAFQQIMFADLIVISKIDLVSPFELLKLRKELKRINPNTNIIGSSMGCIDPRETKEISRNQHGDLAASEKVEEPGHTHSHSHSHGHNDCNDCERDPENTGHGHSHGHNHEGCDSCEEQKGQNSATSHHLKDVTSFSVQLHGTSVDPLKFAWWLRRLSTIKKEENGELYRAKGILSVAGSKSCIVFHGVQDIFEKVQVEKPNQRTSQCKVVFIGRRLNEVFLKESFQQTIAPKFTKLSEPQERSLASSSSLVSFSVTHRQAFNRIFLYLDSSADVCKLGLTCKGLYSEMFAEDGMEVGFHHKLISVFGIGVNRLLGLWTLRPR